MRARRILIGGKRELEGQVYRISRHYRIGVPLSTGRMRRKEGKLSLNGRRSNARCEKR